jgi:hypothetical protein
MKALMPHLKLTGKRKIGQQNSNGHKRVTRAFQRQEALENRTTNNQGETEK